MKEFMYIREHTMKKFENGVSRFIIRLAKKSFIIKFIRDVSR